MSWKIKRVIRTDITFGYPVRKGYEVELETDNGAILKQFMTTEEFFLRKFLEDQYTQAVVDSLWKLIEDYGMTKYSEGYNEANTDD